MLHPQAAAMVAAAADEMSVADPAYDLAAEREQARRFNLAQPREDVAGVADLDADGVRVRRYDPAAAGPGVLLHLHGGGFVLNDVDVHDAVCRRLANRARATVLSVDYRRPPEHPYPAAPDDVDTVIGWLEREGDGLGLAGPWFAHGDSAGANLALVATLRHPGRFAALALIYPFIDARMGCGSYDTEAEPGFDREVARWYWSHYAGGPDRLAALVDDPGFSPYAAPDLHGLPPTLVVTAEHDLLRDEGESFAARMAEQGGQVVATRYLGMIHGFWRHVDAYDAAEPLMRQVVGFLGSHAG